MSQVTISGAVSGLDTASIINQLVQVQTNQQTLLRSQQSAVQKRADAYSSLATALGGLGTLAADLAKTSAWTGSTASSTSTNVTAKATGTASGSITFDVTAVAAAHTLISSSAVTSTSDVVAAGPLTLTKGDGSTSTIEVGTGSLSDVVSAINASGSGLSAAAVHTGPGAYKLQVTATATGASSDFTLAGVNGFASLDVLTQGADAVLSIGKNLATAYEVTSSTNTFSGLVDGLSFTVGREETGVTVSTRVDGSTVADKVGALVDRANSILSDIAGKSAYDSASKTGGPFTGESAVRSLQQNILSTVSRAGAPGVSLTRDGKLTFDRAAFLTAFTTDPAKVAQAFGASSSFAASATAPSTTATVSSALKSARAGTYALSVDSAARREQWSVDGSGGLSGKALSLTRGSQKVSYTVGATDTLADVATAINRRGSEAGLKITATVSGSTLLFTSDVWGSPGQFATDLAGVAATQVTAGADIAGTIDGQTAEGLGNVLSLPTGTGGAVGLSVQVSTTGADLAASGGEIGSITFSPGLAQRLTTLISDATASTGTVQSAEEGANAEVKRYQKAIDDWDSRLTSYRKTLTLQFTAMETALAKLKSATSALSQLSSSSNSSSSSNGG